MWVGKSETRPARLTKPRHSKFEYNMCKNTTIIIIPPRCAYLARVPVPKVGPELRRLHGEEQGRLQHHQVLLVLLWSLYIVFVGGVVRLGFWKWGVGRWAGRVAAFTFTNKDINIHAFKRTGSHHPTAANPPITSRARARCCVETVVRSIFGFFLWGRGKVGVVRRGGVIQESFMMTPRVPLYGPYIYYKGNQRTGGLG